MKEERDGGTRRRRVVHGGVFDGVVMEQKKWNRN